MLSGNTLYGTAQFGGNAGEGSVFRVNTDGTRFTNLYDFSPVVAYKNGDGVQPNATLVLAGSTLYGTASQGGSASYGTLFAIDLPTSQIPLTIRMGSAAVVLIWSDSTFSLQAAATLGGPYTNIAGALSPYPLSCTAPALFFRLKSN